MLTSERYRCYSDVKVRLLQKMEERVIRPFLNEATYKGAWYMTMFKTRRDAR
jgi:hypothetical protein